MSSQGMQITIGPKIGLKTEQTATLTHQQQQSLRILQLDAVELSQEIRQAAETNPLLELIEPDDFATNSPEDNAPPPDASPYANENGEIITTNSAPDADACGDSADETAAPPAEFDAPARRDDEITDDADDTLRQELESERAEEFRDERATGDAATSADAEDARQRLFDNATAGTPSLEADLFSQADLAEPPLAPNIRAAFEIVVGELDRRGLLTTPLSEIALENNISIADIKEAVKFLKTLDPPGIGAATTRECFLIQLRRRRQHGTLAALVVDECYELLMHRRLAEITKKLECSYEALQDALRLLATLNTAPAHDYERDDNRALAPDVFVRRAPDDSGWLVTTNSNRLPRLRINMEYKMLATRKNVSEADKQYVSEKIREGRAFISALGQRENTLVRVVNEIVRAQPRFFERGPRELRPLTMSAIAQALNVHETTVGRAINGKNVSTPHGVFELRRFFPAGLPLATGNKNAAGSGKSRTQTSASERGSAQPQPQAQDAAGAVTIEAIHRALSEIIAGEDKRAPLNDTQLCAALNRRGIQIARRTISKYRDQLNIPNVTLRRFH